MTEACAINIYIYFFFLGDAGVESGAQPTRPPQAGLSLQRGDPPASVPMPCWAPAVCVWGWPCQLSAPWAVTLGRQPHPHLPVGGGPRCAEGVPTEVCAALLEPHCQREYFI